MPIVVPPRQSGVSSVARDEHAQAAQQVIRDKIDRIYQSDPNATMPAETTEAVTSASEHTVPAEPAARPASGIQPGPGAINMQAANQQAEVTNPYERTHDETKHQVQASAWQTYHSAWQSYYQQYYERYYVSQVHAAKKSLESDAHVKPHDESISTDEAMYDLRSKLRNQISEQATKVRKSRHFMPAIAALGVMLIFLFLQYNRVMFAAIDAYITPGNMDSSALIIDPNAGTNVSSDPVLIVPKIAVDVPIVWDANPADQNSLNAAMDRGVAWFNVQGASAKPGEMGNFAVSGHSSNDWLDKGDYKFIFARLEQLAVGDTVYVNYNGTRYTYTVTGTKVVKPTDVSALQIGTDKPRMTLITCTPLGTALNRLLVFADQVSPDPAAAAKASASKPASAATKMPSNSPTFVERLFGIGN